MTLKMVAVVLLARIWESKVREEKEENADEKSETKQAAQNQLHFPFHLWSGKVDHVNWLRNEMNKRLVTICFFITIFVIIIINSIGMIDITAEMKGMLM